METPIIKIPEVERVLIEDFGIIKKADIKFSPGLNIIVGRNGSGKTTVVRYLTEMYDFNTLSRGQKQVFQIEDILNKTTLLMDDNLDRISNELLIKALKELANCKRQVILTLNSYRLEEIENKVKADIIDTKDFELKMEVRNEKRKNN